MRTTKNNQQQKGHKEIVDAVKALASEKGIDQDILFNAIEEAMKAAYKKNSAREENIPANLTVTLDRSSGDAHVFARKLIVNINRCDLVAGAKVKNYAVFNKAFW